MCAGWKKRPLPLGSRTLSQQQDLRSAPLPQVFHGGAPCGHPPGPVFRQDPALLAAVLRHRHRVFLPVVPPQKAVPARHHDLYLQAAVRLCREAVRALCAVRRHFRRSGPHPADHPRRGPALRQDLRPAPFPIRFCPLRLDPARPRRLRRPGTESAELLFCHRPQQPRL